MIHAIHAPILVMYILIEFYAKNVLGSVTMTQGTFVQKEEKIMTTGIFKGSKWELLSFFIKRIG